MCIRDRCNKKSGDNWLFLKQNVVFCRKTTECSMFTLNFLLEYQPCSRRFFILLCLLHILLWWFLAGCFYPAFFLLDSENNRPVTTHWSRHRLARSANQLCAAAVVSTSSACLSRRKRGEWSGFAPSKIQNGAGASVRLAFPKRRFRLWRTQTRTVTTEGIRFRGDEKHQPNAPVIPG